MGDVCERQMDGMLCQVCQPRDGGEVLPTKAGEWGVGERDQQHSEGALVLWAF